MVMLFFKDWLKRRVSFATQSLETPHQISLDLSYITDEYLCCSFPTSCFPRRIYRNDIQDLVRYLNLTHGDNWMIFSLRTQHSNEYDHTATNLEGKFTNHPWKDHEGPPFTYLLRVLDDIGDFIELKPKNVAVVHCRMGKGRSGLIAVTYLMYRKGYSRVDAENLFTDNRMAWGFGEGISIKSQMKYSVYMALFCESGKIYQATSVPNIKIRLIGAKFKAQDSHVEFWVGGYDVHENDIDPVLMKPHSYDVDNGIIEAVIPESHRYTDIRISLAQDNFLGLRISTVYLWFNIFFEQKYSQNNIGKFTWEDFDGLKGTGKRGYRLFNEIELHF